MTCFRCFILESTISAFSTDGLMWTQWQTGMLLWFGKEPLIQWLSMQYIRKRTPESLWWCLLLASRHRFLWPDPLLSWGLHIGFTSIQNLLSCIICLVLYFILLQPTNSLTDLSIITDTHASWRAFWSLVRSIFLLTSGLHTTSSQTLNKMSLKWVNVDK